LASQRLSGEKQIIMKNKEQILANTIQRCKERGIIIPTYKQMRNPELIPEKIQNELKNIGLWDMNSLIFSNGCTQSRRYFWSISGEISGW